MIELLNSIVCLCAAFLLHLLVASRYNAARTIYEEPNAHLVIGALSRMGVGVLLLLTLYWFVLAVLEVA